MSASAKNSKRTIKRKLDDAILEKARTALGLPAEGNDDDDAGNSEPSLKWRKPRHNTAEGQAYIKSKAKRRKQEEDQQTLSIFASPKKEDKKGKKKKNKKKKSKKPKTETETEIKDPESEKRHGMEAISYLQLWSSNRDHWKFEKLKQTWLLKNCLNQNLVDDKRFEILVEYIGSVKGAARRTTLAEMQTIVTKYETGGTGFSSKDDSEHNESNPKEQNNTTPEMYDRARQIIQILVDD